VKPGSQRKPRAFPACSALIGRNLPKTLSGNLHRGTPGRALAIFAACLAGVTALSIHKWWDRRDFEESHFPTGLGDTLYYEPSERHFETPAIKLPQAEGQPIPLYRQNIRPVNKPDEWMVKVAQAQGGDFWFYRDSRWDDDEQGRRIYVKTGEGEYIEFGYSVRRSPAVDASGSAGEGKKTTARVH
jgi:hypothetical protein